MVCKETHRCPEHGWLFPEEVDGGACTRCGRPVETGRTEKMSKSRRNVIDPDHLIDRYGADTARLFSLFAAPPERDLEWSHKGVEGAHRFLGRVWNLAYQNREELKGVKASPSTDTPLTRKTHRTVKRVTGDIERAYHFNTAIAALMELANEAGSAMSPRGASEEEWASLRYAVETLLLLLSPFSPHIAEELWEALGNSPSILQEPWPGWDEELAKEQQIELVVQINGKVRSRMTIDAGLPDDTIKEMALADTKVREHTDGKPVKKVFVIKGRLVNIVL
jgi:leucyl-tRNA synthetase